MALASALPSQRLVIGVPVFIGDRFAADPTRKGSAAARRGRHLHRHARVAQIAPVLAARRRRSQSSLLLRHEVALEN